MDESGQVTPEQAWFVCFVNIKIENRRVVQMNWPSHELDMLLRRLNH
jgi:hypothetical protein